MEAYVLSVIGSVLHFLNKLRLARRKTNFEWRIFWSRNLTGGLTGLLSAVLVIYILFIPAVENKEIPVILERSMAFFFGWAANSILTDIIHIAGEWFKKMKEKLLK